MRSLQTRIAALFAVLASLIVAALLSTSYLLLQAHLTHNLDSLLTGHFGRIRERLDAENGPIAWADLVARMGEVRDYRLNLLYVDISVPGEPLRFISPNLRGHTIPDEPRRSTFDGTVEGIGPVRIYSADLPTRHILIATPLAQVDQTMAAFGKICLGLFACVIVVSVAAGAGLGVLVVRPIRVISASANRIKSDNLHERIDASNMSLELAELAVLLNQTFERLEVAFAQVRRFSDEASHELRTPLTLIRLHAEKLACDPAIAPHHLEAALDQLEEIERLNHLIDDLLFLSRAEAGAIRLREETIDPQQFLAEFEPDATALAQHYGCRLEMAYDGTGRVRFEPRWIRQVLLNVISNALAVSPSGGTIRLQSTITSSEWTVTIEDEGPGLTSDQCQRIFERFVRFDGRRPEFPKGAGLGLAICQKLIDLHRGSITAKPVNSGTGLSMNIRMPTR